MAFVKSSLEFPRGLELAEGKGKNRKGRKEGASKAGGGLILSRVEEERGVGVETQRRGGGTCLG